MRRVLTAAAIAAFALGGFTGGSASAEFPCNSPWFSGLCKTINDLIGDGG